VSLLTVKLVAADDPKLTAVAPVKPEPVIATEVPPAVGPAIGEIAVIVGGATKVILSPELTAEVPPAVVTVTFTTPADSAGAVTVIDVGLLAVRIVPATDPKFTAVAANKLVPVIVTVVPPNAVTEPGETELTAGAGISAKLRTELASDPLESNTNGTPDGTTLSPPVVTTTGFELATVVPFPS